MKFSISDIQNNPTFDLTQEEFHRKNFAVWPVSHCHTKSKRENLVRDLKRLDFKLFEWKKPQPTFHLSFPSKKTLTAIDTLY